LAVSVGDIFTVVHSGVTAIYTFFFTAAGINGLSKMYSHFVGGAVAGP
jgi:hypothetical protein